MFDQVSNPASTALARESPAPRKKGKNWTRVEDEQLCRSWLAVSEDPLNANEQRGDSLWERIHAVYMESNPSSERTQSSLQCRWTQVHKSVNKFAGCLARVEAHTQNENSLEDKIQDAISLYEKSVGGSFTMFHLWTILRHAKKWQEVVFDKEKRERERGLNKRDLAFDDYNTVEFSEELTRERAEKRARFDSETSVSLATLLKANEDLVEIMRRKAVALELTAEDIIMSRDTSQMDDLAKQWYAHQKSRILKKITEDTPHI